MRPRRPGQPRTDRARGAGRADATPGGFFRDAAHCELLARHVLPALGGSSGRRRVQVWSAGCAAGEDAWSLAMLVEEADLPPRVEARILATESDATLLARAGEAVYADRDLAGVDAGRRRRHFVRGAGPRQGLWRVIAPLRDRVELVELELRGPWPALGGFDLVCSYGAFTELDRTGTARLARRLAEVLVPGGVLLLGAAAFARDDLPELAGDGGGVFRRPDR